MAYPFTDFGEVTVWHHVDIGLQTSVTHSLPVPFFLKRTSEGDVVANRGILAYEVNV